MIHAMTHTYRKYFIFVVFYFLIIILSSTTKPLIGYGDHISDTNVYNAGANFKNFGFKQSHFLPVIDQRVACVSGVPCAYVHYPPLPDLLNGFYRTLGIETLGMFRFLAVIFSFATALLLPFFFKLITRSDSVAIWASISYITNMYFVRYIDSIHQMPLREFFWISFALSWLLFLQKGLFRYVFISYIFFFLSTWTTFEHFAFIPIWATGALLIVQNYNYDSNLKSLKFNLFNFSDRSKYQKFIALFFIYLIPVFTIALRVYHNSFHLGSINAAITDLLGSAHTRSNISWFILIRDLTRRFTDFLLPFSMIFIMTGVLIKKNWSQIGYKMKKAKSHLWLLVFWLSGIAWWILMRQHAYIHAHIMVLFIPFSAIASGYCIDLLFKFIKSYSAQLQNSTPKLVKTTKVIIFITFLIVIGKSLRTSQFNRYIPFYLTEYNGIKQLELAAVEFRKNFHNYDSKNLFLIDENDRFVSWMIDKPFVYVDAQSICQKKVQYAKNVYLVLNKQFLSQYATVKCSSTSLPAMASLAPLLASKQAISIGQYLVYHDESNIQK